MGNQGYGALSRYRCHIGHACTQEVMMLAFEDRLSHAQRVALVAKLATRQATKPNLPDSGPVECRSFSRQLM